MDDKITLTVALANINSTLEVLKDNPLFPSIIQPNLSSVKLVLQDQLTALEPAPEGQTVVDLTGYHDLEPEIPPVEVKKNHTYRIQEETTEGWVNYEDQNKKVSQLTKLVQYATNDDALHELRDIVQTICNTLDWEREAPKKELSVYLIRGFYNFEKRLHPLLDDAVKGMGYHFDILDHIEDYFAKKPQKMYLGSTTIDKKPWQHLIKVADRVNETIIESGQRDTPYFSLSSSKFVDAVYALANPSMGRTKNESVSREDVEKYIRVHVRNFK